MRSSPTILNFNNQLNLFPDLKIGRNLEPCDTESIGTHFVGELFPPPLTTQPATLVSLLFVPLCQTKLLSHFVALQDLIEVLESGSQASGTLVGNAPP
jgi:hypothetical protein